MNNKLTSSLHEILSPFSKTTSTKRESSFPSSDCLRAFFGNRYFFTLELNRTLAVSDISSSSFRRADEIKSFSTMYAKLSLMSSLANVMSESEQESQT